MRKLFLSVLGCLILLQAMSGAEEWGETGHRTTGKIAEQYLTKKAQKTISRLLDGHSLAFVSTFADEIRSDPRYRELDPWHYVNFPFDSQYESYPKSEKGDIIQAINTCLTMLSDPDSTRDDKSFYLKLLVHYIGDLHQPLHIGLAEDRGGNRFQVRWFDEGTNLHTVWDTKLIESYNMSYTELAANADQLNKKEVQQIMQGSITDWMYESRALCENIYSHTEVGENLSYEYRYRYMDVVRKQLQAGGIRLAHLLNDIFD